MISMRRTLIGLTILGTASALAWAFLRGEPRSAENREAESAYQAGLAALRRGEFETSYRELDRARALGHDGAKLERAGGLLFASVGRDDEAEPLLTSAWTASNRRDPEVAEALGRIYLKTSRLPEAIALLRKWAEAAPGDPRPARRA